MWNGSKIFMHRFHGTYFKKGATTNQPKEKYSILGEYFELAAVRLCIRSGRIGQKIASIHPKLKSKKYYSLPWPIKSLPRMKKSAGSVVLDKITLHTLYKRLY